MKNQITIDTTKDFKAFVGERDFHVTYRKAIGTFRGADGSLVKGFEAVKGTQDEDVKEARADAGLISYFDFEKKAFRSFKLDKMIRLEVGGQVYQFGL